ncbi:MAG: hypothetical protein IH936_08900, partial [Acidobacteria bacterium]|nr:hypothetical protein [Acidobacteriota bacterium]
LIRILRLGWPIGGQNLLERGSNLVLIGIISPFGGLALAAWGVSTTDISLLDMLLLGYAMVVPPAIAIGYLFYWERTSEAGLFWGMAIGYLSGIVWYIWTRVSDATLDTSYITTLVPLVLIPLISLATHRLGSGDGNRVGTNEHERFYSSVAGLESRSKAE